MSYNVSQSVIDHLQVVIPNVESGYWTIVNAGEYLTGLLGHPDIEDAMEADDRIADLVGSLGPDMEWKNFWPSEKGMWLRVKGLLEQVVSDYAGDS